MIIILELTYHKKAEKGLPGTRRTAYKTRVILTQVALEMLAYLLGIEARRLHIRSDFDRLSTTGRILTCPSTVF